MFNRTQTIDFRSFVRDEYLTDKEKVMKIVRIGVGVYAVMIPKQTMAASTDNVFEDGLLPAVMNIVDWLIVGVIIFGGVSWMFGHRTKALEYVIGGCCGYILARHAIDIRDFLQKI